MDQAKRDQLVAYLVDQTYPPDYDKAEKRALRRLATHFFLKNDRVLYHFRDGKSVSPNVGWALVA